MDNPPNSEPYFTAFLDRTPPSSGTLSGIRRTAWHAAAGMTIGVGLWYLSWRWMFSLNSEALVFSATVALAETMTFLGTLLFFFNIWDEEDSPNTALPKTRQDLCLEGDGDITVDMFITTYDEDVDLVAYSVDAAKRVDLPPNIKVSIYVADDGNRDGMRDMAQSKGVGYMGRTDNRGYKAGNLANALFQTDGDFIVICDADTQVFPGFIEKTIGYFHDPKVAFVQTPHWFYDIPEGVPCADWLERHGGKKARLLGPFMRLLTRRDRVGTDPFLSDSSMFFDVIQRRRNRHNASFCCGAGSVHRREAIFENALLEQGAMLKKTERQVGRPCADTLLPQIDMQPFRYHVSEDIYTSLQQHSKGWKSVYHPEVLARMLSPWNMHAWATQKLKYAGGTYDIMLRTGLIFRSGMPWATRLHYLATFWSYLSCIWILILFIAPMFSLLTGLSPVDAYSIEFFAHLIPLLVVNEIAMSLACKGHDIHAGRVLSLATLNIQFRALFQVLRGKKPHFPPTDKNPTSAEGALRYIQTLLVFMAAMAGSAAYGVYGYYAGFADHSASLVLVNLFWLGINALSITRIILAAFWRPRLPDGSLLQTTL